MFFQYIKYKTLGQNKKLKYNILMDGIIGRSYPYFNIKNVGIGITQSIKSPGKNIFVNYIKDKYGTWILYDPQFEKNTFFLWLIPLFLFIFGGILIVRKLDVLKKKQ